MKDCCPRRWDSLGWFLQDLLLSLFRKNPKRHRYEVTERTWEALALHCFAEELRLRVEVDALARDAATHGAVPESISAEARHYLALRIQCALDFLGMVFPPEAERSPFGDAPENWTDAQLLEWLLIDLWVRRHDHWLKLEAMSVAGPFALYGVCPADPENAA